MSTPEPAGGGSALSRRELLRAGAALGLGAGIAGRLSAGRLLGQPARSARSGVGRPLGPPSNPSGARGLGPNGSILPPGTRPFPHLPPGTASIPQIEHIVVMMMENHSFDDHLGMLGRGDGLTLGPDGKPVNYNPDPNGGYVRSYHLPDTCVPGPSQVTQTWDASHICWDHGTNMGFVTGCGATSMGYWDATDLPYYYSLASQFPIGDRYFCSVMAQTYPNRRFLIAATAYGDVSTGPQGISQTEPPGGTIFDTLDDHGITWKDYYPDLPTCALFLPVFYRNVDKGRLAHINEFLSDAAAGKLPSFSLVDPYTLYSEEHGDISVGEAFAARIIDAVLDSPLWEKTALVLVYDEHGGWYDHVPPQPAVQPDNVPPEIDVPPDQPGAYDYTGFRVPCIVVSPWARRDYVSHQVFDHTSILKLIETKWNLPALTYRDANANDMTDFFDFSSSTPPFADPPRLTAPQNPLVGPLPASSSASGFHPLCTSRPGYTLPPAQYHTPAKPPNADALIAAHSRQALGLGSGTSPAGANPVGGSSGSDTPVIIGGVAGGVVVLGGAALLAARRRGGRLATEGSTTDSP